MVKDAQDGDFLRVRVPVVAPFLILNCEEVMPQESNDPSYRFAHGQSLRSVSYTMLFSTTLGPAPEMLACNIGVS